MPIIISHTRQDGTTVDGSTRGDGVLETLRALTGAWRWSRHVGIYLNNTRDQAAKSWKLDQAADAIRALGFDVEVHIDNTEHRTVEQVRGEKFERVADRTEGLQAAANQAVSRANAADQAARRIGDSYPMGQPILVGHHSEGRHRRDLARMHKHDETRFDETRRAENLSAKADAARGYRSGVENPGVAQRRIVTNQAAVRRIERRIAGEGTVYGKPAEGAYLEDLTRSKVELEATIAADERLIEAAKADGFQVWGPGDFEKGDLIVYTGWTLEVYRVNKTTLTVQQPYMPEGTTWKVRYVDGITKRIPRADVKAARAAAAAKAAAEQ